MKKTALISAAVGGLLLGATATSLTSCSADDSTASTTENANLPKHACKGLNDCKNQGGCKGADNSCKGNNDCKGQGGCATVAHHGCKGQNTCKGLGGCGSGDNGCKAKNSCEGKGGCGVPIKH